MPRIGQRNLFLPFRLCFQQFFCDIARNFNCLGNGAVLGHKPGDIVGSGEINAFRQFFNVQIGNSFHILQYPCFRPAVKTLI